MICFAHRLVVSSEMGDFWKDPEGTAASSFTSGKNSTNQSSRPLAASAWRERGEAVWTAGAARLIWALKLGIKTSNQISLWSRQSYGEIYTVLFQQGKTFPQI